MPEPIQLRKVEKYRNEESVKILKDLLARAESGDLIEFTSLYRVRGDADAYMWAWTGCKDVGELVQRLEIMKYRMLKRLFNDK
jgi:hypothetical protein